LLWKRGEAVTKSRILVGNFRMGPRFGVPLIFVALISSCVVPQHAKPGEDCIKVTDKDRVANYDTAYYHAVSAVFTSASPQPWCRPYKVDKDSVSRVIMTILPRLGNPIKTADIANGIFLTEEIERSHATARWKDRYSITVTDSAPGEVTVRVLRLLQLYTVGGAKRMKPAETDGHNEKWILTQIGDGLSR